jgi:F-type H+-transporting ATPase subunit b
MEVRAGVWLDRIEQHLADLSDAQRREIGAAPHDSGTVRVVTAAPLPDSSAAAWRDRLGRALGDGHDITFDVDPALVAGAELHFPHAILRFSWRNALTTLRSEIEHHDDAR